MKRFGTRTVHLCFFLFIPQIPTPNKRMIEMGNYNRDGIAKLFDCSKYNKTCVKIKHFTYKIIEEL